LWETDDSPAEKISGFFLSRGFVEILWFLGNVFKRVWKDVRERGKPEFRAKFTWNRRRIFTLSVKIFGKTAKKNQNSKTCPHIHTGFQQLVENFFENFPPSGKEEYGYPKPLENSCGKRCAGSGKLKKWAKK